MKKYNLYQAHVLAIKRKIFWYFLFKGVFLYKIAIRVQDIHGNSFNNETNYLWWPYNNAFRVFLSCNKKFIASVLYEELDERFYKNMPLIFFNCYKKCMIKQKLKKYEMQRHKT